MAQTSFDQRKQALLAELNRPTPDKSPKGSLDLPVVPLCGLINAHPNYCTTSSCSGRVRCACIHLWCQADSAAGADGDKTKKGQGGGWLYCSHEIAKEEDVEAAVAPEK
eukprot:260109-Pyramimonas_sp.AAC.3